MTVSYCNNCGMTQYRIVITVEWLIRYWVIPHLLKYDTESYQSYYNTILSHSRVNTIRSLITPQLLQYDTESFQLLQYDTESFHSYYNTILSHSTVITIRYCHSTVITIRYWVIPRLLQCDTESSQLLQYNTESFHSYYNTVSYCNNCGVINDRFVIAVKWISIVLQ
jgi:hypothetical protein